MATKRVPARRAATPAKHRTSSGSPKQLATKRANLAKGRVKRTAKARAGTKSVHARAGVSHLTTERVRKLRVRKLRFRKHRIKKLRFHHHRPRMLRRRQG